MIDCVYAGNSYDLVKKLNAIDKKIDVISIVPSSQGYLAFYKIL